MDDMELLTEEVAELRRRCGVGRTLYAVRLVERNTEDDPEVGTLMYSMHGPEGPWHDMVTGHPEWCWEIVDALQLAEEQREARRHAEAERLRAELDREAQRG